MSDMTTTIKRYSITVEGFGPKPFLGATASVARYKAFKALRSAGYRYTFRDFLSKVNTLHFGAAIEAVAELTKERGT